MLVEQAVSTEGDHTGGWGCSLTGAQTIPWLEFQGKVGLAGHCRAGGSGRLAALEGKSFTSECANF